MATVTLPVDVRITGSLSVDGGFTPTSGSINNNSISASADIDVAKMGQVVLAKYGVPLTSMRVWDAIHTLLPSAGATDDLGLVGGTFAPNSPLLKSSDAGGTTVTQYARFQFTIPNFFYVGYG